MARLYDATFGRGFSAIWDQLMKGAERSGLRAMRRDLLSEASGRTIDLGAGTGTHIGLFPTAVTELCFVEPDPHMTAKLRPKLRASGLRAEVIEAGAENLPFDDASIDTVVSGLALCTIPDPNAALVEIARVLRPGGRFLFIEHVRADDARLSRWQDRLEKPWHFLFDGCYCNRETAQAITASPLVLEGVRKGRMPRSPALVRPLILGSAILPA